MTTIVANMSEIDRIDISLNGSPNAGWFYTKLVEKTFALSEPDGRVLTAQEYPLLAAIWDNEEDTAYDNL